MKSSADYFELFDLPRQFAIDLALLSERYRLIQAEVHPDRFAAGSDQERRIAMQYSAQANDAYQCLKSPVRRAGYLLELAGHGCDFDRFTLADAEFLMLQMSLREQLEECVSEASLLKFQAGAQVKLDEGHRAFVQEFEAGNFVAARDQVARLHFLDKLNRQAEQALDHLDD